MRRNRATRFAPLAAAALLAPAVLLTATACGPTTSERLAGTIVGPGASVVSAFEADLAAGRIEEALLRSTAAFQAAAPVGTVRQVAAQLRLTLGARQGGGSLAVEDVETGGNPPRATGGVLIFDSPFEHGAATVRARVEFDAVRRTWLLDGYEVRTDKLTWTLRR